MEALHDVVRAARSAASSPGAVPFPREFLLPAQIRTKATRTDHLRRASGGNASDTLLRQR